MFLSLLEQLTSFILSLNMEYIYKFKSSLCVKKTDQDLVKTADNFD